MATQPEPIQIPADQLESFGRDIVARVFNNELLTLQELIVENPDYYDAWISDESEYIRKAFDDLLTSDPNDPSKGELIAGALGFLKEQFSVPPPQAPPQEPLPQAPTGSRASVTTTTTTSPLLQPGKEKERATLRQQPRQVQEQPDLHRPVRAKAYSHNDSLLSMYNLELLNEYNVQFILQIRRLMTEFNIKMDKSDLFRVMSQVARAHGVNVYGDFFEGISNTRSRTGQEMSNSDLTAILHAISVSFDNIISNMRQEGLGVEAGSETVIDYTKSSRTKKDVDGRMKYVTNTEAFGSPVVIQYGVKPSKKKGIANQFENPKYIEFQRKIYDIGFILNNKRSFNKILRTMINWHKAILKLTVAVNTRTASPYGLGMAVKYSTVGGSSTKTVNIYVDRKRLKAHNDLFVQAMKNLSNYVRVLGKRNKGREPIMFDAPKLAGARDIQGYPEFGDAPYVLWLLSGDFTKLFNYVEEIMNARFVDYVAVKNALRPIMEDLNKVDISTARSLAQMGVFVTGLANSKFFEYIKYSAKLNGDSINVSAKKDPETGKVIVPQHIVATEDLAHSLELVPNTMRKRTGNKITEVNNTENLTVLQIAASGGRSDEDEDLNSKIKLAKDKQYPLTVDLIQQSDFKRLGPAMTWKIVPGAQFGLNTKETLKELKKVYGVNKNDNIYFAEGITYGRVREMLIAERDIITDVVAEIKAGAQGTVTQ